MEWALALSSVGTTCLMIRFLMLIWPSEETHAADGLASRAPIHAWASLSVIGLVGFWIWTGAFPWAVKALAPAKLWSAVWPIAVGGAIMFWFSRRGSGSTSK